jgi:hypothetical protein
MSIIARLSALALAASVVLGFGGMPSNALASTAPAAQSVVVKKIVPPPAAPVATIGEIDHCKDKALIAEPFTGSAAQREAQAKKLAVGTKVLINGVWTSLNSGEFVWERCNASIVAAKTAALVKPAPAPVAKAAPAPVAKTVPAKKSGASPWWLALFAAALLGGIAWMTRKSWMPKRPKPTSAKPDVQMPAGRSAPEPAARTASAAQPRAAPAAKPASAPASAE